MSTSARAAAATAQWLYALSCRAATPLVRYHLRRRAAAGREDPVRVGERMGVTGAERPPGALVWIHGASVGESVSALPVVERIRRDWPDLQVLVTTGTVTSAHMMGERLPAGAIHHYAPVDLPAAVAGFLGHWRPNLGLLIESELWPNLLAGAHARGVDLVLVNGRMSAASFAGWRRFPPLASRLMSLFTLVLAQTPEDAARFRDLGAGTPVCHGNLKFAAPPLHADAAELARLHTMLGSRPRWLAASTHEGEDEVIGRVHAAVAPRCPGLLTLLAPRHPNRGPAIAARLRAVGHRVARRSNGESPSADTEIYIADTMGELGLWYRLTEIVVIGGSLAPKGGQNVLEPARLGCAIVCGPHMNNFLRMAEDMARAKAIRRVADNTELTETVGALLHDTAARQGLATAAAAFAGAQAGVLDGIMAALAPHLDRAVQSGKVSG